MSTLDELLGIDMSDPVQRNARQLVESDRKLIDDLIAARVNRNASREDIAALLGVGVGAVAAIESEGDPHLSTLRRYALAVGARVEHSVSPFTADEVDRAGDVGAVERIVAVLAKRPMHESPEERARAVLAAIKETT